VQKYYTLCINVVFTKNTYTVAAVKV